MKIYFAIKNILLLSIFIFSIEYEIFGQNNLQLDCFTIIVGKNASIDGSVIVAHNEDDWGKQIVNLYRTSEKTHNNDDKIILANGGTLKQINKTNGFIWLELPGMKVADGFINDNGVVVASNGCPSREDKPDSTDGGILYWLRRIVAERANTAKHGVRIAGQLIENYGYVSSGRTYTIADNNEAWVLSAVYGKHWIAQRVPDDQIAVIPNFYTIKNINLSDTLNYLGSSDIISYAVKRRWHNPKESSEFNFAKSYTAITSINHPGNINRIWRGINLLSQKEFKINQEFPFSFNPFKKVDVEDIMEILKDHYENCELDKSEMYKNGDPHYKNYSTICSETTQYSFVVQLRPNMPVEIGTMVWLTYFRPCVNLFAPIYLGIKNFPDGFSFTNAEEALKNHFDPDETIFEKKSDHVYWDFVSANEFVGKDFSSNFPKIKNRNNLLQKDIIRKTKIFENEILNKYSKNKEKALKQIEEFSQKNILEIHKNAISILNDLE
ncbi:MAG: C69 family dipeptidase [Ignavibacteriae bacterium]|nr:C69 family dipeptidase [Ignavibacteriota bacterium]